MKISNILFLIFFLIFTACNLIEEQVPQNSIPPEKAISNPAGARAALNGAYDAVQNANYYGTRYLLFPDLQGGNLAHTGTFPSFAQIANRQILSDNVEITNIWATIYSAINRVNQILDKVPNINDPSFTDKNSVLGQAYLLRAFHYFNLVRYWGGVPIKLTPTDVANVPALQLSRNSVAEVYQQVLADIDLAITNLPAGISSRFRASRAAAYALKARVHLYRSTSGLANEYQQAIDNSVLAGTGSALAASFTTLFVERNTTEAIWQIEFNSQDQSAIAFFLLPTANGGRNELRPTSTLQNLYGMTDLRRIATNATSNTLKYYRPGTGDDYAIIFRLAEMLLTRAEALIARNTGTDLVDALALINQIRNRAAIGNYAGATDQTSLRDEVYLQRRLELALEGHHFFDLVRTGRAAAIGFTPNQQVFPIPQREILSNPNLAQNPGY